MWRIIKARCVIDQTKPIGSQIELAAIESRPPRGICPRCVVGKIRSKDSSMILRREAKTVEETEKEREEGRKR